MSEEIQAFDQFASKRRAAFAAFKSTYSDTNPPPLKDALRRDWVSVLIIIGLILVTVASVAVSASRTIPEFGGGGIGLGAFIMLEGGLIAYPLFRARRNSDHNKTEDTRKRAMLGLSLAFIAALSANLDEVLKSHGVVVASEIKTAINILVAISAPTLAFISSDVLAIELLSGAFRQRQADEKYTDAMRVWGENLNTAWNKDIGKWGVKVEQMVAIQTPDRPRLPDVTVRSDSQTADSGQTERTGRAAYGFTRTADGRQKVIDYLTEHGDAIALSSRDLAKLVGVGHDTANKGKKAFAELQEVGQ